MKNDTTHPFSQTQSGIAFKVGQLMLGHVNGAFRTFDANIISKYLKIATINFVEKNKT